MKILCLSYEYPPIGGGGSVVCRGLSIALAARGHRIDVVTTGMKGLPSFQEDCGVNVHRVRCIRRNACYTTSLELATTVIPIYRKALELFRQHHHDINHTHFIVPTGISALLLHQRTGLPYVLTAHGSDIPGYNPDRFRVEHNLIRHCWRRIAENSSAIVSPSNFLKDLIQTQADVPVTVVNNGYHAYPDACHLEMKKDRILVVTRMFERKGVQHLIEAIRKIDTHWEFLIVGDGPYLTRLKALAVGLERKVRFLGFIKGPPLFDLYRTSKIFLFPSVRENFPVVLMEAMEAGCAIITTDDSGCAEVVGDAAIIVEAGSADQIRNAIEDLTGDDAEIRRLSTLAQRRIRSLSWPNIAPKMEAILQQVSFSESLHDKGKEFSTIRGV